MMLMRSRGAVVRARAVPLTSRWMSAAAAAYPVERLRNVAIIAHVDHGKTTLVDKLFDATRPPEKVVLAERAMDSNVLEKERGITILAKNCAVMYKDYKINIIDTPGHADFGGEVERILSMADGVLLLVDASEGPRPQTRFVSRKALARGLRPIVVLNKMDKLSARHDAVLDEVFHLFESLGASEAQLDFPIVFASAANGWASLTPTKQAKDMTPLLDAIIKHVPAPKCDPKGPFQFQVTSLDYSSFIGGIAIGRVQRGTLVKGADVSVLRADAAPGTPPEKSKVQTIMTFNLMERVDATQAVAGDLVALSGIESPRISDTWCQVGAEERLPLLSVDEPTLSATFEVNTSPLAGKEGTMVTSRHLRERLMKETLTNVALKVEEATGSTSGGAFKVSGRGEMHLGILIETMRREGFEMSIGRPSVICKVINGEKMEPYETLFVDVDPSHQSWVMEQMGLRGGDMKDMEHGTDRVRMEFSISTRALIGFRTEFLQHTAGTGIMYAAFDSYRAQKARGPAGRASGVLISNSSGTATAYSLEKLQSRGKLFVGNGETLYEGMLVGLHVAGDNDLTVNAVRPKQLTNIRAATADDAIVLHTPIRMTLERAIEFIEDDELVEVTPTSIRLRKKELTESGRKNKGTKAFGAVKAKQ